MKESIFASPRPLTAGMRWMLLLASILVLIAGALLFVLTDYTDRFFAWTVKPPLTAAFLGAGYWAAGVMEFLASREHIWGRARITVPTVLLFTTLTLVATLLHLDRFHFNSPDLITLTVTWAWLAIYVTVPIALLLLLILQLRVAGVDPPRQTVLPLWVRVVLGIDGVGMLAIGLALFLEPEVMSPLWPWTLTALTGRAIGAWLLGMGFLAVYGAWENEWSRTKIALVSAGALGALELLAVARYPGDVNWRSPGAWVYVLVLLSFAALGAYAWHAFRKAEQKTA
jgi:hypothetical protein